MQREDNLTPASPEQLERLREQERERKRLDPGYITAAEAAALSPEMRQDPRVRARVTASSDAWPERRASMTEAMGADTLPQGEGGSQERRQGDIFQRSGKVTPDAG